MSEITVTHVKPGETLSEIAARYGVSVDGLQRWNRIENPDLVLAGQRIVIYKAVDMPGSSASGNAASQAVTDPHMVDYSQDIWIGSAIVLGVLILLILLHRRRHAAIPISRDTPPSQPRRPIATDHGTLRKPSPPAVSNPLPAPEVNDGERLVSSELMKHYRDWILIDDVLIPSGSGTTQIDHILVSSNAVFLIETKDMNGWVFGGPGDKNWTQSYKAGYWSRMDGVKSNQFEFYNPLRQNEGHAKALVKFGIVDRWRLRPIVVFVGSAEMKTATKFLSFDEHEKKARQNRTWRMRGVVCMNLANLHRYIQFSINASSHSNFTYQEMEMICRKIREIEIPKTAESHARHVDFVQSVKEAQRHLVGKPCEPKEPSGS